MMMVKYLIDQDAPVRIPGVASPEVDFGDLVAPVELALEQERRVTAQINELTKIAREEKRFRVRSVHAVVHQGAGRGGRDDERPGRGGAPLEGQHRSHRGLHPARTVDGEGDDPTAPADRRRLNAGLPSQPRKAINSLLARVSRIVTPGFVSFLVYPSRDA